MEIELSKIMESKPLIVTKQTYDIWKELGPFQLSLFIDEQKIKLDERYNVTKSVYSEINAQYQGQSNSFATNNAEGVGRMEYQVGDMYEGESSNGEKDGFGRYIWSNGEIFVGYWKNGTPDGEGKLIRPDGSILEGTFDQGRLRRQN